MMRNLKVSICLASYNGELFIKRQVETILPQLYPSDEIIISDDSSNDSTLDIIQSFNDKRIKLFANNNFRSPMQNFQHAIMQAQGDIIFLCDQDDIWFANKIERHLELHKDYDLVISDAIVTDSSLKPIFSSFFKARDSRKGIIHNLLKNRYIGCCMSFDKKIVSAALPFPKNLHMHDWWIGLVAELVGQVYFLNEPLMYYIRHNNNASGTLTETLPFITQLKNRLNLIKNLVEFKINRRNNEG